MEYSGPVAIADIEADLALSDDDDNSQGHWPPLELKASTSSTAAATPWQPQAQAPQPTTQQGSHSAKRPMVHDSDTNSEPSSPATKTSKLSKTTSQAMVPELSLPRLNPQRTPSQPAPVTSAFAPRTEYVKLRFRDNPTVDMKLRWLTDVTKTFRLDRELAEVKMSAVTSNFVFISRHRQDIVDRVTSGEFLSLYLDIQDSVERPRKFPTYLITRYPVGLDPALAKELSGIHTVRRFRQHGTPINRLVVTWSLQDPPPRDVSFSFLPCLPPCELRRMKDEQPWCFKCWAVGHISRYCSAPSDRCGWCSADHATRACPYRIPSPPTPTDGASTSEALPSPAQDTSKWKCPRCHEPGATVWHGCIKKRARLTSHSPDNASPHTHSPPPPPPPQPRSDAAMSSTAPTPVPKEVLALREAVASLMSRCSAITARFDKIEARMDSLVSQHATTERTLATLVESHHAVLATVNTFAEKMDALASRVENFTVILTELKESSRRTPHSGAPSTSASPPASRTPRRQLH